MEYLSRCLATLDANEQFTYHLRCKRIKLTHLLFANDLLLFCKADKNSIRAIMGQFQKFSLSFGLEANNDKCEIYFCGVDGSLQDEICQDLGMAKGSMPFKYLGIPLNSRKLNYVECKMFLDKIIKPVMHWTSKFLSYGARVYFINSVLAGIRLIGGSCLLFLTGSLEKLNQFVGCFCGLGVVRSLTNALLLGSLFTFLTSMEV